MTSVREILILAVQPWRVLSIISVMTIVWLLALIQGFSTLTPAANELDQMDLGKSANEAPLDTNKWHFPLKVVAGSRYLSDADNKPFLIIGDAAWSLIAQLKEDDVDRYLADRRSRGFNTLLVNLIEHKFSSNAPDNAYHEPPFLQPGNFGTPNERYFAHADWVLHRAAEYGFLVLLTPSYAGAGGGPEGWYKEMEANGPVALRQYGRYLGQRYRNFHNIIWVQGGDFCPPNKSLVRAIADGIHTESPDALQTAHCAPAVSPLDVWRHEPWLRINTIYTYTSVLSEANVVQRSARAAYTRPECMPFFLIEGVYENEFASDEKSLRKQAYEALLSGASGQVFGNNPVWHFSSGGIFRTPLRWLNALGGRGAQSMTHLSRLFSDIDWWDLEPDLDGKLLNSAADSEGASAVAAFTPDRTLAIVYFADLRPVIIDLTQLAGSHVTTRWYDPAEGRFSQTPSLAAAKTPALFSPPGVNWAGFDDWVLVLEASQ